jgi:hypothetical protein
MMNPAWMGLEMRSLGRISSSIAEIEYPWQSVKTIDQFFKRAFPSHAQTRSFFF